MADKPSALLVEESLASGKQVTNQTLSHGGYRRTLANMRLLDGTHVNYELVNNGLCWWYRKYAPADSDLERLEKDA